MAFSIRKVLISEPVDAVCGDILQKHGIDVTTKIGLQGDELLQEIQEQQYDGLVVRSATKVTADVIEAASHLKIIGRAGTGVDNIDCIAATKKGILVVNAPGGNTLSAAELTCGMVVSLSRNVPQACASLKSGEWNRKGFMGHELLDKTLAIIGLGRIGREVATRMQSFGMKTIGFDPLVPAEVSQEFGVESMELEAIWPLADYITVHTPLIKQTKNLINDDVFAKCKKGVKIVNCARGGIIDEDALVRALESGQCGGAGLDVFLEEPPKNTTLLQHPKVICTPHLGASTVEAQSRVAEEIAQQFVDIVSGKSIFGVVNSPAFCDALLDVNQPWVSLCQSIGKVIGAISKFDEKTLGSLTVYGSKLRAKEKMLTLAALVGILKSGSFSSVLLQNEVNFINAPGLADKAKIKLTSAFHRTVPKECSMFSTNVLLGIITSHTPHTIAATLKGNVPLICAIDGCAFKTPVPLVDTIIICHSKRKQDKNLTAQIMSSLPEQVHVFSASWSTSVGDSMYCILNCSIPVNLAPLKIPEVLTPLVDSWAQIDF